jgi:ATP phosphoribosyltransferase regulatory subunit
MKIERFAEGVSLKRSVEAGTADQRKAVQDITVVQNVDAFTRTFSEVHLFVGNGGNGKDE